MNQKKSLLSVFILGLLSASAALAGDVLTSDWVDNFGVNWVLSGEPCMNGNIRCVTGTRDSDNTLKCGALPVRGSESLSFHPNQHVLSMTVFSPSPDCAVSTWFAVFNNANQSWAGFVWNNDGKRVPFTLRQGHRDGASRTITSSMDPSRHTHR